MEAAELFGKLHWNPHGSSEQRIESIKPKNLGLKNYSKVAGDGFGNGVEVECTAELRLHGGDWLGGDAAGDDEVKVAEIGVHV